jgi:SAM-dependent methyltransferase
VPTEFRKPQPRLPKWIVALSKGLLPRSGRFYLRALQNCRRVQFEYLKRRDLIKALRGFKVHFHIAANLISVLRLLPTRRFCEFCDWSGFSFVPIYYVDCYRTDVFCPRCRLMDRYRTLVHFVRRSRWGAQIRELRPRTLDVAPTESSRKMLATEFGARESVGFDILNPWADVLGDLQDIPFPAESFDLFLCYEVLDYIKRDDVALTELRRVLKPGSYGLLRVGFSEALPETIEYSKPDADDSYHIRRYGRDLSDRFRAAGFDVELVNLNESVSEAERKRFGLDSTPVFFLRRPAL